MKHDFANRVLNFDIKSAIAAATISANYRKSGKGVDVRDIQIAGIVAAHDWTLATRNIKDFQLADIDLVNPWEADLG